MPDHEMVMSGQVRSGEDMSGHVTSGNVLSDQDESGRIMSTSCGVRSGQIMSGQV